ncbi:chromosome partitioning protein ParA, partial [Siccirubricoccus sp. KC 17139]|nr:chromosome partitioning protein ParA [Siccirubricoccus soli]MCP2686200.1 chromosome partitioning protein ParA [Siccirubricoccus soli]
DHARARAEAEALRETLAAGAAAGGKAPPVLEAVQVPPGLEAALGAALGEALEHPEDAGAPRHWRALPPLEATPPLPDGLTPLASLVTAPPALARALGQIGVLPEGGDGAAIQPLLRPGQAVVGRDGALWRWDGHVARADAPNPGAVRLQQRARLRAAEARLREAAGAAESARQARDAAAAAEQRAVAAEAAAREARRQAEASLAEARTGLSRLSAAAAEAESRL